MGFQTKVNNGLSLGKQNMHLIGYVADGVNCAAYFKSSLITDENGAIDRYEVMHLLLAKHSAGTDILLHAVSNIGLQEVEAI
ncbi:hypothetical protein ACK1JC_10555 [Acinetobacter sp. TY2]|uniref:hypothetical protein n=1 Tax=Acinetobacter sp. TY2 TaxID=3387403 RepID=UPI003917AEEF